MSGVLEALTWLMKEHGYTVEKFGDELDDKRTAEFSTREYDYCWWPTNIERYLYRAHVLGLDTPGGRQALAKAVSTALGFLVSATRVHGELPEPGHPSGEIKEWGGGGSLG